MSKDDKDELCGFYVEIPARLRDAFKMYCDANHVSIKNKFIDIIVDFLRKEGYLDQNNNPTPKKPSDIIDLDELLLTEERRKKRRADDEDSEYEGKKLKALDLEKERKKMFERLRKEIGGRKLDELRMLAEKCGLKKPDPEDPDLPLLETIVPAIRNMRIKFNTEKTSSASANKT